MKKSLSLILAMVMVFTMFASVAFAAETPAPLSTQQKYEALKAKGIFDGFTDGSAGLDQSMTRAQFAKVLATLFKLPQLSSKSFNDTKGHWAAGYIEAVAHSNPVLMEGTWAATFSPEQNVKVEELAAVLVRALNLPIPTTVTVTGTDDWAKGYVAAALAANLIPASADYTQPALRGALVDATYVADVKLAKPTVASATATVNANGTATVAGKAENADSVKVTVGTNAAVAATLNADGTFTYTTSVLPAGTTNISVVASKGDVASAAFALTAAVTQFGVSKVDVLNGKQVKVTFNGVYDDSTVAGNGARYTQNYTLGGAYPVAIDKADGDTAVVLTFADGVVTATQDNPFYKQFTVQAIAKKNDAANAKSTLYSTVIDVNDKTAPTITEVSASTNGTAASSVTIKFSEPVTTNADSIIKVDTVSFNKGAIDGATWSDNHATVKFITGLTLNASSTHTVEAVKMQDYGNKVADYLNKSLSVTTDATLPTLVSAVPQGDSTILLTFSEKVTTATVVAALPDGNLKNETFGGVQTGTPVVVTSGATTEDTQFKLPILATGLFNPDKTARTLTLVVNAGIADTAGNVTTAASTTGITLSKDTVAPTVTGVGFKTSTSGSSTYASAIVVTFSENVALAGNVAKLTVVDSNGVLQPASNFLSGSVVDNTATFGINVATMTTGTYTVTVGAGTVKDVSQIQNENTAYTGSITVGTSSSTTYNVVSVTANGVNTNKFDVNYTNAAVKGGSVAGSATDVANYTLNGAALPAGTTITLNGPKTIATITLPGTSIATSDTAAVLTTKNIVANDGNNYNSFVGTVNVVDNIAPVLQSAVINGDQVTLTYNEEVAIGSLNAAADYKITVNGNDLTGSISNPRQVTNNFKTIVFDVTGGNWNPSLPVVVKTVDSSLTDKSLVPNKQKKDVAVTAVKQS